MYPRQNGHESQDSDDELATPPSTYAAHRIATWLLPHGLDLFEHRSSANCILRTGTLMFYVHVPMLASRSPTLRGIFDEMIKTGAFDEYDSEDSDGDDDDEDSDMTSDDTHARESQTHQHGELLDQEMQLSDSVMENSDGEKDIPHSGDSDREDDDGNDDGLPELTLELADPEGSCFRELLKFLYTGNGQEWVQCFTADNYGSILQNICYLNIRTPEVVQVCRQFEASVPGSGLQGKAEDFMRRFVEQQQLLRQQQQQQ
ncbi:hypothetical protein BGX27_002922 [Mortierella sp. AM989]|nr:hypothetical protein BGX27_002922 [Mortierella sp. AM989]